MSSSRHSLILREPLTGVRVRYAGPPPVAGLQAQADAQAAYERGKQEAGTFHNRQLAEQREEIVAHQKQVLQHMDRQVESLVREVQQRLPALLFALVERVLEGVELTGSQVSQLVESVLQEYAHHEGEILDIYLSPEDLRRLKDYQSEVGENPSPHLTFHADTKLKCGDCQIRSRFGLLDARLATRVAKLKETVLEP